MDKKAGETEWELWEKYAIRVTKHLKSVRKGTRLQNIRSKEVAIATERITRQHPYVRVLWIQKRGKHKGRKIMTTYWAAKNVRVVK